MSIPLHYTSVIPVSSSKGIQSVMHCALHFAMSLLLSVSTWILMSTPTCVDAIFLWLLFTCTYISIYKYMIKRGDIVKKREIRIGQMDTCCHGNHWTQQAYVLYTYCHIDYIVYWHYKACACWFLVRDQGSLPWDHAFIHLSFFFLPFTLFLYSLF